MELARWLLGTVLALTPPAPDAEVKLIRRWRVNVSVTLGVLVFTTAGFIAVAFGAVAFVYPGFASAKDVSDVTVLLNDVRTSQLDNDLFNTHVQTCQAVDRGDRDLAIAYQLRIQDKLSEYAKIAHQRWQQQPCPGHGS